MDKICRLELSDCPAMKTERSSHPEIQPRSRPKLSLRLRLVPVLVATGFLHFAAPGFGQTTSTIQMPQVGSQSTAKAAPPPSDTKKSGKKKKKTSRGSFAAAPIPISSPAIGSGIVPVVGYIFPLSTKDKKSPPSVIGAAGLLTNNGSRGFAVGGQLYMKENTYEVTSVFAHGDVDYNIYGSGIFSNLKLPLEQSGEIFQGEVLRQVGAKIFVGPRFSTGRSFITIKPNSVTSVPIPPDVGLRTNLTAIGGRVTRDTSVNRFYPTNGSFLTFTSDFFAQALGSKYSFQSYRTQFNRYISLDKKQVLAYDAYFCATGGKPPFYGNCIYGANNELRGYTAGKYFDRFMLTSQLEYRLVLPKRFGVVGFGGLGGAFAGESQLLQRSHFLPAGGVGLRFEVSKPYHVNLRADFGQGVDGHTFGLGILEAF